MQAEQAYRVSHKKSDKVMGLCDFTCPTDCERRDGARCLQNRGSTDEGRKVPFSRRVYPSRFCPHNRDEELAQLMHMEGITEWR